MTHSAINNRSEFYSALDAYRDAGLEHAASRTGRNLAFAIQELSERTPILEVTYRLSGRDLYAEHGDSYNKLISTEPPRQRDILVSIPRGFADDPSIRQMIVVSADDPTQKGIVGPRRSYVYIYTRDEADPSLIRMQAIEASPHLAELRTFLRALGVSDALAGKEGGRYLIEATALRAESAITSDKIVDAARSAGGQNGYGERIAMYFDNRAAILAAREELSRELQAQIVSKASQSGNLEAGIKSAVDAVVRDLNIQIEGGQRRAVELYKEQYKREPVLQETVTVFKPRGIVTTDAEHFSVASRPSAIAGGDHAPRSFSVISVLGWGNWARWDELVIAPKSKPETLASVQVGQKRELEAISTTTSLASKISNNLREKTVLESPTPAIPRVTATKGTVTRREMQVVATAAPSAQRRTTFIEARGTGVLNGAQNYRSQQKQVSRIAGLLARKAVEKLFIASRALRPNQAAKIGAHSLDRRELRISHVSVVRSWSAVRSSSKLLLQTIRASLSRALAIARIKMGRSPFPKKVQSPGQSRFWKRAPSHFQRIVLYSRTAVGGKLASLSARVRRTLEHALTVSTRNRIVSATMLRFIRRLNTKEVFAVRRPAPEFRVIRRAAVLEQKLRQRRSESPFTLLTFLHPQRLLERLAARFKERQRTLPGHSDLSPLFMQPELKKRRIKLRSRSAFWINEIAAEAAQANSLEEKPTKTPETQKVEKEKPALFVQAGEEPVWYLKTGLVRQSSDDPNDQKLPSNVQLQ